jgi:hypothetical protein
MQPGEAMTHTRTPADHAAAAIEAEFDGRWGIWLSGTGRWWAAYRGPLTAADQTAGCVPFLRAATLGQLTQDIRQQEHLRQGREGTRASTEPGPRHAE